MANAAAPLNPDLGSGLLNLVQNTIGTVVDWTTIVDFVVLLDDELVCAGTTVVRKILVGSVLVRVVVYTMSATDHIYCGSKNYLLAPTCLPFAFSLAPARKAAVNWPLVYVCAS